MADIAYSFAPITPVLRINSRAAGNQSHSDVTRIGGSEGGFFVAFNSSIGGSVNGRSFNENGRALSGEFKVNTTSGYQLDPAAVSLSNRTIATAYEDHSRVASDNWKVRGNLFDEKGRDNEGFFLDRGYKNGSQYNGSSKADIALVKGGYVISWQKFFSETAHFYAQRFNASGDKVGKQIRIQDTMGGIDLPTSQAVAGLANGGFVSVASSVEVAEGLIYYFQRFGANGRALDKKAVAITSHNLASHQIVHDNTEIARIDQSIKAVGLRDGGFAVAYVNPVDLDATHKDWDIVVQIYNANGTARTDPLHVGTASNSTTDVQSGNQDDPNITVLSNDSIAVSWTNHTGSDTNIQGRVLDAHGKALTDVVDLAGSGSRSETESSLAGLSGGKFVATWTTTQESGTSTTGIQGREFRLSRTTTGDDTNETLNGDSLVDRIFGQGGDDIVNGKSGNDVLFGGAGKDIFVFDLKPNRQTNFDKISDFSPVDDSIYLSHKIFSALGKSGSIAHPTALSKAAFWTGTAAHDANDRIIYNKANGALYYDPDGKGGAEAVKIAALSKGLPLTANDFLII